MGRRTWWILGLALVAGCSTLLPPEPQPQQPAEKRVPPEKRILNGPTQIARLIPARVADRNGWAEDIQAAMAALQIEPNGQNVCAVLAVTEQESDFRVDPPVPGLPRIARVELEKRREQAGVPKFMVDA